MRQKTSKWPWIILPLLGVGGVLLWRHPAPAPTTPTESVMTVTVVTPKQTQLSQTIHATGITVARDDIVVAAELPGMRITRLLADEGKWVKRGQPLAELDGASIRNQFAQLDAAAKQAEQNFRRLDRIRKTGAVSESDIEEKRSAYLAAKTQRDDAALKMKMTTLTAPESGLIYQRTAQVGSVTGGTEPLFRIARDGAVELDVQVAESDMAGLKIGQEAAILIPGRGAPAIGKIRLISPRVDNATRAARLRIGLPKEAALPIGSFAEIEIATRTSSGLALPQTAVNMVDGKPIVWVVGSTQKVTALPVTVTLRSGDAVLVQGDGLTPDLSIVAKAGPFLREGDAVSIAAPEPAQ